MIVTSASFSAFAQSSIFASRFFLAIEFFELEVNTLIVVETIYQCMIACPECFRLWTWNRADDLPLFLQFLESIELVIAIIICQRPDLLKKIFLATQVVGLLSSCALKC